MSMTPEESKVLVSACLVGEACRYDGQATPHPAVLELVERGLAVPVCPELLGGLGVPRAPIELVQGRAMTRDGRDCTAAVEAGVRAALELALSRGCLRAVLKQRSPTCGCGVIYDGTFSGRRIPGDGLLTRLLKARGIGVTSEEQL